MRRNLKIRYFSFGILVALLICPFLYFNRKPINKILGRTRRYDIQKIDLPENFAWYKPSNHHFINTKEELIETRKQLKNFIININEYKLEVKNIIDKDFSFVNNLSTITQLNINHSKGVHSNAYLFKPIKRLNRLIIFHQGHGGSFKISKNQLGRLIDKGYDVIAFQMPLKGTNPSILNLKGVETRSHNALIRFNSYEKSFISLFITPVIFGLDQVLNIYRNKYDSISMIGISGGGWTTLMTSAIEPRIDFSFSIAGTLPITLCNDNCGDIEHTHPTIYDKYPYLDLYLLGSTSEVLERHFTQISYTKDPCCHSGSRSTLYSNYVNNLSKKFDGNFATRIEESEKHEISQSTLEFIENKINNLTKFKLEKLQ